MTYSIQRSFFLAVILALLVGFLPPKAVSAAYIQVTHTYDGYNQNQNNYCTLRMAIVAANENRPVGRCAAGSATEMDTIILGPGSYQLDRVGDDFACTSQDKDSGNCYYGDLDITESLMISGTSNVTIHATLLNNRIFHINTTGSVVLSNLTLKLGVAPTIEAGLIRPGLGGAVYNQKGTLTINHSVIDGNNGPNGGGGIANESGAYTKITGSILRNNVSRIGGGILNNGVIEVKDSLIFNNTGSERGGGFNNNVNTGTAYLTNVTISNNGSPEGSALFSQSTLHIVNSTIAENTLGEAIYITGGGTIVNTIVAGHVASNCLISASVFFSHGYNLFDDPSCTIATGTDKVVAEPDLTKLVGTMDHAGKGETMYVLPAGSPAIDGGTNAHCPSNDQRGLYYIRPRTGADVCDIGSYEVTAVFTVEKMLLPAVRR